MRQRSYAGRLLGPSRLTLVAGKLGEIGKAGDVPNEEYFADRTTMAQGYLNSQRQVQHRRLETDGHKKPRGCAAHLLLAGTTLEIEHFVKHEYVGKTRPDA